MKLLKTKNDEYIDHYGYVHKVDDVPCIIYEESRDFGIGGDGFELCFHKIPKNVKCIKSYFKGFKAAK